MEGLDIDTDCSCDRTMAINMAPGSSPGTEDTMALGGSTRYSGLHGPSRGSTLRTNLALVGGQGP